MQTQPTALILLFDGFEEMEAIAPIDLLRRAGVAVTLAACGVSLTLTGRSGIQLQAETTLSALNQTVFDSLILPGGPGCAQLHDHPAVMAQLSRHAREGALIAAICAAPTLLHTAGLLERRTYTAHFTTTYQLPERVTDRAVVEDGSLITAQGAGAATAFALAIVKRLAGEQKANAVAQSIAYTRHA